MGIFHDGKLRTLGDPLSLLKFPDLAAADKWRFARTTLAAKLRGLDHWRDIENVTAEDWLLSTYGPRVYALLFQPLLESKFQLHAPRISAAWMWARLHRLGNSRSVLGRERIGYLEGGSQTYVDALEQELVRHSVAVHRSTGVDRIAVEDDRVSGGSGG